MLWEITIVLALVLLVLVLFVKEVLPPPVTAISAAAILMVVPARNWDGAILDTSEGLSGFASPATIAVLAMFVLSAGIERTGIVQVLGDRLIRFAGTNPRRQALSLGAIAGPASGFVNNTPVVAVLMPVATRLAQAAGHSPSLLLMPLSFFAMLGGTLTVIGTSTNLLGNTLLEDLGVEPFGMFDFMPVGVVALAVAALYFLVVRPPVRDTGTMAERFDLKGFAAEFEVPSDSPLVGTTLRDAGLVRGDGLQVVRIHRHESVVAAPRGMVVLEAGDLLLVQGSRERLEALAERGFRHLAEIQHGIDWEGAPVSSAELVIAPGSRLEGKTIAQARVRDRFEVLVLAVRHRDRVAIGPLSRTRLVAGDVLLVQGTPEALDRLEESSAFFLTREREQPNYRRDKMVIAVGIIAAVVAVAALGWIPIVAAALAGAVLMVLTGCLEIDEFLASIRWDIVLLLAGILPLGVALQKSGATAMLAEGLGLVGVWLPPLAFLILIFIVTSLITELVSNNASVVLLLPVAVAAALQLGLNPVPFALAVMLSASTSMLTPIGYQTNTMVYAPGGYRFADFARVGGPLNLVLAIVIPTMIAWLFPL